MTPLITQTLRFRRLSREYGSEYMAVRIILREWEPTKRYRGCTCPRCKPNYDLPVEMHERAKARDEQVRSEGYGI